MVSQDSTSEFRIAYEGKLLLKTQWMSVIWLLHLLLSLSCL